MNRQSGSFNQEEKPIMAQKNTNNSPYQNMVWSNMSQGKEPNWSLYDAMEIHPLVNLNCEGEDTCLRITDKEDPDIYCWCVYGHLKVQGGIEDLHDVSTQEEAKQLALYCQTQIETYQS